MLRITACLLVLVLVGCQQPHAPRTAADAQSADRFERVDVHWENGKLRERREELVSADGHLVLHGLYGRWYETGVKEYACVYIHGQLHGPATSYHPNGRPWIEEHYYLGQLHGTRTTWDAAGRRRKQERYADGKPTGVWTTWDAQGQIKGEQTFEHLER
jgi:antitoxin component YwqK of YwqJK toxin-antitoxin module